MQDPTIVNRLDILERKVELLEALPARVSAVESQILQLRNDMNDGFSALRVEIRAGNDALRTELREEMRAGNEALRTELRAEIRAGDEETRNFMRVLHEDVIARIATIRHG
jgi:hypothetical protein